jgi:hypothetical protein
VVPQKIKFTVCDSLSHYPYPPFNTGCLFYVLQVGDIYVSYYDVYLSYYLGTNSLLATSGQTESAAQTATGHTFERMYGRS